MSTKHQLPMGPRHWSSKKGILGVSSTTGGRRVRAVRRVAVRKAVDESSLTRMLGWFVSEIIPVTGFFSVVNFRIACRILDATHLFFYRKHASGLKGVGYRRVGKAEDK